MDYQCWRLSIRAGRREHLARAHLLPQQISAAVHDNSEDQVAYLSWFRGLRTYLVIRAGFRSEDIFGPAYAFGATASSETVGALQISENYGAT